MTRNKPPLTSCTYARRCTEFKADFGHVVLAAKAYTPGP